MQHTRKRTLLAVFTALFLLGAATYTLFGGPVDSLKTIERGPKITGIAVQVPDLGLKTAKDEDFRYIITYALTKVRGGQTLVAGPYSVGANDVRKTLDDLSEDNRAARLCVIGIWDLEK